MASTSSGWGCVSSIRAANEQFFDLSVGQGFERLLQPYHSQSASTILLHQPVSLMSA